MFVVLQTALDHLGARAKQFATFVLHNTASTIWGNIALFPWTFPIAIVFICVSIPLSTFASWALAQAARSKDLCDIQWSRGHLASLWVWRSYGKEFSQRLLMIPSLGMIGIRGTTHTSRLYCYWVCELCWKPLKIRRPLAFRYSLKGFFAGENNCDHIKTSQQHKW